MYVWVYVIDYLIFKWFDKKNLLVIVFVSFIEVVLGFVVDVLMLNGFMKIRVFVGIQNGKIFWVLGQGVEILNGIGDLFVMIEVVVFIELIDEQCSLFEVFCDQMVVENLWFYLGV